MTVRCFPKEAGSVRKEQGSLFPHEIHIARSALSPYRSRNKHELFTRDETTVTFPPIIPRLFVRRSTKKEKMERKKRGELFTLYCAARIISTGGGASYLSVTTADTSASPPSLPRLIARSLNAPGESIAQTKQFYPRLLIYH